MSIPDKALADFEKLPETKQLKVIYFIEQLAQQADAEEGADWSKASLALAVRDMDDEQFSYTVDDLEEVY